MATDKSKEAMKLALEALEAGEYYIDDLEAIVYAADDLGTHEDRAKMQAAITALREALVEQPAQRTWFGLTDEEIEKGRDQTFSINNPYCPCDSKTMRKAVRWAEAKLREKNA